MRNSFVFMVTVLAMLSLCKNSHAVGATEWTQMLNNFQLIRQTANQVTALYNQAVMIKNQLENLKSLGPLSRGQWSDAMGTLRHLDSVVRQGRGITYTMQGLAREFKRIYPGYSPLEDYAKEYQEASNATKDTIQSSLEAAGEQSSNFETENSTMAALEGMSDSAQGQKAAIQAGNKISGQVVYQLQLTRQLIMSQMQSQAAYQAYQVNNDQMEKAAAEEYFQEIPYTEDSSTDLIDSF